LERNPIWEEPWWRSISQNGRFGDLSDITIPQKTQFGCKNSAGRQRWTKFEGESLSPVSGPKTLSGLIVFWANKTLKVGTEWGQI